MKYYEVSFTLTPDTQEARDILAALGVDAGFESFEDDAEGLVGYAQQELFDAELLDMTISNFPLEDTTIIYKVREAEDRNWNETWEQEGFDPIVIDGTLVIHDGRHLPDSSYPLSIEIDTHMAFGTGTHETTRMICAALLRCDWLSAAASDTRVLDCGSGTGILGICALKLGAASCTAYDIDEWSVENTRHNSIINEVEERMTVMHGDASLLEHSEEHYQIVMANINRNILLQDMERFTSVMAPRATLIISGFYQEDCPMLIGKAQELGLELSSQKHEGNWACMCFRGER